MHVVLIDDCNDDAQALMDTLELSGHGITWTLSSAVPFLYQLNADVVLLDLDHPRQTGEELLQRVRQISTAPLLALVPDADRLRLFRRALDRVDDHLLKPINPDDLLNRIELAAYRAAVRGNRVVATMDVVINFAENLIWVGDDRVPLTAKEFDILAVLAQHAGHLVRREHIEKAVWGLSDRNTSRSLSVYMTTLRAKINRPTLIETVRGVGYRFAGPRSQSDSGVPPG